MKAEEIKKNDKKEENLQEESQPVSNYPYEFYGESGTKKDEQKSETPIVKSEEKKVELPKSEEKKVENTKSKAEKKKMEESKLKKEEKKIEKPKPKKDEKKVEAPKTKKEDKIVEIPKQKKVEKKMEPPKQKKEEIKMVEKLIKESGPKKEEKKNDKLKKEEIKLKQKKETKNEEKKEENSKNQLSNKKENKILKPKTEKRKIEIPKIEEQKVEPKKEEIKINNPKIEEQKNENKDVQELIKPTIEYNSIEKPSNPMEKKGLYEIKEENKINIDNMNQLPKTLLTQKTEHNYDLMMKFFRKDQYLRGDDTINYIANYDDFSSDKFLGLVSQKIENDNKNKSKIDDFLKRNEDDILMRQNNNKSVKERIKQIDESTKKKLYFKNKQSEQEYFDSFYNKQIAFKNNRKEHLDKLTQKYDEQLLKTCEPESKYKHNLKYFRNNEPVKLSKYCKKENNQDKSNNNNKQNNNNQNIEELKEKLKENANNNNENGTNLKLNIKKLQSFGPNKTNSINSNNPPENAAINFQNNEDSNNKKNGNNNKNEKNKKFKKVKSASLLTKGELKLTKKEVEDLTNKLHYDGELLKVKKQTKILENIAKDDKYLDFSKEKLTHSSIIILIKKLLYEYTTSIKQNVYIDVSKNPKLNYEQYIDILKDLYYLEKDAFPETYLEEDTMYKELYNKLIQFSSGPENSIESNVLLIYLLELNGFFKNEKIIKELKNEIYWINLENYDDLLANSKYIEENWDDLKMAKINYIKKLRLEGKYNPIHCEELYNNYLNINQSRINNKSNHYITTMNGNTNYFMSHGYNLKNKSSESSIMLFPNFINKNEENKHSSFSKSNLANKNMKRIPLQDSYNDLIIKRKNEIEYLKNNEEQKLKEICTFKPQINNNMNKKLFRNKIQIELPKFKKTKSNLTLGDINCNAISNSNINISQNTLTKTNKTELNSNLKSTQSISKSPLLKNSKKIISNKESHEMKRNKSSLQKMFAENPLKNDKTFNDRTQKLKIYKTSKEKEFDNYNFISPMRFDIEYHNKYEGIGMSINRDSNVRQRTQNVIFYNIKVNENIKTLKYVEGDDLKLNVINFVKKNKLPEEVTDIILTKIKEKTIEETF